MTASVSRDEAPVKESGQPAAAYDEAIVPLGYDHPTGLPSGVEHDHLGTRPTELPGGGQARQPRAHDRDRHVHPRAAAVARAISASVSTSNGSSFKDGVRSS